MNQISRTPLCTINPNLNPSIRSSLFLLKGIIQQNGKAAKSNNLRRDYAILIDYFLCSYPWAFKLIIILGVRLHIHIIAKNHIFQI